MITFLGIAAFLSLPFVVYGVRSKAARISKDLQTKADQRFILSIELDRRDKVYRFGGTLNVRVAVRPQRACGAASLRVGIGYAFKREGHADRLVQDVELSVPGLLPGEEFETTVAFQVPSGLPSYAGYSAELIWGVHAEFDTSLSHWDAHSRVDFTVLPGTSDSVKALIMTASELVPSVGSQGEVRYRRFIDAQQEAMLRYGSTLGAVGFSLAGLVMLGILTGEAVNLLAGPELVLVNGEWMPVEPWQPNLNPVIRFIAQGFGFGVLALFAIIPCLFGYKLATIAWREHLRIAWVERRLGQVELVPLEPAEVGAPWTGQLRLRAKQDMTLEVLELKLVEEEVVVHTRTRRKNPTFAPHILSEWSVGRHDQLTLNADQFVTIPLEGVVANELPGSWQLAAKRGHYEVHHRWVLRAWIKPILEAPIVKTWVLEFSPSSDYQPKVCEPSTHH